MPLAAKSSVANTIRYASYPFLLTLGLGFYAAAIWTGLAPPIAGYIAVALATLGVIGHELLVPYRRRWRPDRFHLFNDGAFLGVVQILLPYALVLAVVDVTSEKLQATDMTVDKFWPHERPVLVQAALMLLVADFFRYWLHRGFHKISWLWRLHAVHHSPHRLYWLNVGRFHPIEKAMQFMFDALPFAVLGLSPEVLSAYFVFYAINGFFQHSNCDVRLGLLNYLVSGPELHRWHHSRNPDESDTNFGNNLIIWDTLFGTRFLPEDCDVGEIGLLNRRYPTGFAAQMLTPFRGDLDKRQ